MKRNDELQHDRPLYWASPAAEILASIAAAMSHSYHFLTRRRRRLVIPLLLVFIFAATHIQAGKRGFTVGSGRDQLLSQYRAFPQNDSCWPRVEIVWDLPPGITPQRALKDHSQGDLLLCWENGTSLDTQIAFHRGAYDYGAGVQENSISAMVDALRDGSTIEIDVKLTRDDQIIVVHDFGTKRVTNLPVQPWRELALHEVENAFLTIREIERGAFTDHYRVTHDRIITLDTFLKAAFKVNPHATIFVDTNEDETAIVVAWLSHNKHYLNHVAVMFYSHQYQTGQALSNAIDRAGAASDWRATVPLLPNLYPEELPVLAHVYGTLDLNYEALLDAGNTWIGGFVAEKMRIVAFLMLIANLDPNEQVTGPLTDPDALASATDRAAIHIMKHVSDQYPKVKLASGTRSYIFRSEITPSEHIYYTTDLWTGLPLCWPKDDAWWHIRKHRATPGNAARAIDLDLVISDRPFDDIALRQWRNIGIDRKVNFDFPLLNTRNVHRP